MPGKGRGKGKAILTWVAFSIALVILLSLGTWQVERLAWKERLLADMAERRVAPPVGLAPDCERTFQGREQKLQNMAEIK